MIWKVQFKQRFNGQSSQSTTEVEAQDIYEALEKFEQVGYVNATVNAVFRPRPRRDAEEGGAE